jgi:hypothetical protein
MRLHKWKTSLIFQHIYIMVFIFIFTGHWEMKYSEIIPTFNFSFFHHFEKHRQKIKMWYENAGHLGRDAASQDKWFLIFWSSLLGLVCPRTKSSPTLLWEPPNLTMHSQYMYMYMYRTVTYCTVPYCTVLTCNYFEDYRNCHTHTFTLYVQ